MIAKMPRLFSLGAFLVAASRSHVADAADTATVADKESGNSISSNSQSQCGLYLAISSTSTDDNTVWGIYAGKDYEKGETVGVPELAINTHNLRFNVINPKSGPSSATIAKSLGFLEECVLQRERERGIKIDIGDCGLTTWFSPLLFI